MKLQTVFWKEDDMYIIKKVATGVTTQGHTMEEALAHLKEAVSLHIEEIPDARDMLTSMNTVGVVVSRFPKLSGKEIVNILVRQFDFETTRQTGSHMILRKFVNEKKIVTVIPLHKQFILKLIL